VSVASGASPFPFDRVVRVGRESARAARLLGPRLDAASLADVIASVAPALGVGVRVSCLAVGAAGAGTGRARVGPAVVAAFSHALGGKTWVEIDAALAVDLVARVLRIDEIPAPRPMTAAERGLLAYLALLGLRPFAGWRLEGVGEGLPAVPGAAMADLEVVVADGPRHLARLVAGVDTLVALPSSRPRWDRVARLERVVLHLPVVLATARLLAADIRSLSAGDVVVLDADPQSELRLGGGAFPLAIDTDLLRVAGPYQPRGSRTPRAMGDAMDEKQDVLDGIPLELAAEIGRLRLSGRELLDLEPGTVLPLGRPLAAPIELTCDGRVVARGELVDVDGERGVRLTELLA
jgi:type III secretion system YscQ/HrcQ family protein